MSWNGSDEKVKTDGQGKKDAPRPSSKHGLWAGLIVVVGSGLAVLCVYLMRGGDIQKMPVEETVPVKKAAPVKVVAPAAAVVEKTPGQQIKEIVKSRRGRKNLTEEDKAKISVLLKESAAKRPSIPAGPVSPFRHSSDQVIAMVLTAKDRVPPFPGSEEDLNRSFVESIVDPIVINDDDDENLKELKQKVIEARQEIKAGIKEGKSVRQILEEYRQQREKDWEARKEVRQMAKEMINSGEGEMVGAFIDKANEKLANDGIEPVSKPLSKEEHKERARERRMMKQQEEKNK